MSEKQELDQRKFGDSYEIDEVPDYAGAQPSIDYSYERDNSAEPDVLEDDRCRKLLEGGEQEVEVFLDHEKGSAELVPSSEKEKARKHYQGPEHQILGEEPVIDNQEYEEWEPIRDVSGPSDAEKAAARVVASVGCSGFAVTQACFKTAFAVLSAIAR